MRAARRRAPRSSRRGSWSAQKSRSRSSLTTLARRSCLMSVHDSVTSLRTRCSAATAARPRIVSRSPGKSKRRSRSPIGPLACRKTSPTGFSSVPPPGPATPVTDTATSAPSRSRAPRAIAAAVSAETAPCSCEHLLGDAELRRLDVVRVGDDRRRRRRRSTRARRSAAPRRGRPCTTRRSRASGRARAAATSTSSRSRPPHARRGRPASATSACFELVRARLGARLHEEVDVQLEVARADRHLDPVAVAARRGERLRDRRLRDAVEPQHRAARARARARATGAAARSRARAARASAARAAARAARRRRSSPTSSTTAGAVPTSPTDSAPSGSVACLRTPCAKSVYGRPRRSATRRESSSICASSSSSTCSPTPAARASSSIVRSSCVGPRPPETHEQVVASPSRSAASRSAGVVADDRDPRRVDAEAQERRREERAVAIVAVAAHELGARRDDRGAQAYAGRQPVAVTMITRGLPPGTWTSLPRTWIRRFSGESICTHRRLPRIATGSSPFCIVPS